MQEVNQQTEFNNKSFLEDHLEKSLNKFIILQNLPLEYENFDYFPSNRKTFLKIFSDLMTTNYYNFKERTKKEVIEFIKEAETSKSIFLNSLPAEILKMPLSVLLATLAKPIPPKVIHPQSEVNPIKINNINCFSDPNDYNEQNKISQIKEFNLNEGQTSKENKYVCNSDSEFTSKYNNNFSSNVGINKHTPNFKKNEPQSSQSNSKVKSNLYGNVKSKYMQNKSQTHINNSFKGENSKSTFSNLEGGKSKPNQNFYSKKGFVENYKSPSPLPSKRMPKFNLNKENMVMTPVKKSNH